MKRIGIILAMPLFIMVTISAFGQAKTQPFMVKISGKGKQAILFIPGFACSGDVWDATRAAYEKDHTCYTFSMAGFAGIPAEASPTFKGWGDAIATYITQNKIYKPIIIGHSMGGGLAMAIAADYTALPSKIIIVDALPCLAAINSPSFKSKMDNDCSAIVSYYTNLTDVQFYQSVLHTIPQLMDDTVHLKQVAQWSVSSDRKTFAQMYCDFINTDLRGKIANIKCPALILLENSFATIKPAIEDQYINLKTGQFAYAEKGRHFIMYDDADWYNRQLAAFIN